MKNIRKKGILITRIFVSIVAVVAVFCIVLAVTPKLLCSKKDNAGPSWDGSGTTEDPFLIKSLSDLILLRDSVNSGNSLEGYYFRQTCNIDLGKDTLWIPIGEYGSGNYFYGTYDGHGNYISNLYFEPCQQTASSNGGFFGILGGQILNLGIESGCIEGDFVGSLACHSEGDTAAIINCYNKATVIGSQRAGGICDNFSGAAVINCANYGSISAPECAQIVSYNAKYIINAFPLENATTDNFTGFFSNYIPSSEERTLGFLNEGIHYFIKYGLTPQIELKSWEN